MRILGILGVRVLDQSLAWGPCERLHQLQHQYKRNDQLHLAASAGGDDARGDDDDDHDDGDDAYGGVGGDDDSLDDDRRGCH